MEMNTTADRRNEGVAECLFSAQEISGPNGARNRPDAWKVIVADDEDEVHAMTRMVLSDYVFEGRRLQFLNAYSGADCMHLMHQHPETAVILLDVVMESDDAGLQVVRRIREELANPFVRIILRTGQPGKAPETRVISSFDINDYKEKTELTAQKLFTTITAALRSYRDMKTIEMNRRGLAKIIDASASLFEIQPLCTFAQSVLMQLVSLLQLGENADVFLGSDFTPWQREGDFVIIAGMGRYEACVGKTVQEATAPEVLLQLNRAVGCLTELGVAGQIAHQGHMCDAASHLRSFGLGFFSARGGRRSGLLGTERLLVPDRHDAEHAVGDAEDSGHLVEGLHRRLRPDGHEGRRVHHPVRRDQLTGARGAVAVGDAEPDGGRHTI